MQFINYRQQTQILAFCWQAQIDPFKINPQLIVYFFSFSLNGELSTYTITYHYKST